MVLKGLALIMLGLLVFIFMILSRRSGKPDSKESREEPQSELLTYEIVEPAITFEPTSEEMMVPAAGTSDCLTKINRGKWEK